MVHTLPDGTTKYRMATIFGQIDTGELAARLGSIVTHDRRGNVFFMEDFSNTGNRWITASAGSYPDLGANITSFRSNGSSYKLGCGDEAAAFARIKKYMSYPPLTTMGFEMSFAMDGATKEVIFHTALYDGTTRYIAGIKYDKANTDLYYEHGDNAWTKFDSGIALNHNKGHFHTIKMVPNYITGKYGRLIIGPETWDMSEYALSKFTVETTPLIEIAISNYSRTGEVDAIYVDDIILTQNEP